MKRAKKADIYTESLELHRKHKGKIEVYSKVPVKNRRDLSLAYTPGVAEVCREIHKDKDLAYKYTLKGNTIAIVTDGSRVLSLGNIGGYAAIPVMEGKALLFKKLAGIDAFPLCFERYHLEFADDIRNIAPVFGGIALEDIAAPRCFELEESLQDIGIPVMHDDQHGTAVVVLAALINACKVTNKKFEDLNIVVSGAGAAGYAITRILKCIGYNPDLCSSVNDIIVCDRNGIIHRHRDGLYANKYKFIISEETNKTGRTGSLADALKGADVGIGVSVPGIITPSMIRSMNKDPIIFALAHPTPEILPGDALQAGAAIVGTGRNDYPNQINYALAFPGIFRGALDARATRISDEMKVAAAHAIADFVRRPRHDRILPEILNRRVVSAVAEAVLNAAVKSGVARNIG
ncbi:NADP-dependent malic enzyme [Methanoregula sp.]|uniref:NAD(P)-dependent malic enzyme n=1 Tax=Methanoregula sp. TaxID=2052170 RepID=UPI000CA788E2|nr:NADP-dependent malic enzyme [Methanoregula sp.]PKG32818.1 MAG: NAD-dependent malic enzyme [Methanoregula sp.]